MILSWLLLAAAPVAAQVEAVAPPEKPTILPVAIGGRVARGGTAADPVYRRQWPGTYFDTGFRGDAAFFRIGPGEVSLRVTVDGGAPIALVRPRAGWFRVAGLTPGHHRLRVQIVSEDQAKPSVFAGFYRVGATRAEAVAPAARQIEFIGDSHTVGYGNTAGRRDCDDAAVWSTSDTGQGFPAILARRYGADYQVNAISGRGIVRNYAGGAGATLPQAYPFTLFNRAERYRDPHWRPQVIVIALGTNDFSTPLHAGERWPTRDALRADYQDRYRLFVEGLRRDHPRARIILWATDLADGEIAAETRKVAMGLRAKGDRRVDVVGVTGLAFSGCNAHPSVADDGRIAEALAAAIDAGGELAAPARGRK